MTNMADVYDSTDPRGHADAEELVAESSDAPFLYRLGARDLDRTGKVNLDVSGTVGPDVLGQETTNVSNHRFNRPGVQNRRFDHRDPDSDEDDTVPGFVTRMALGIGLPVLVSSDMETGPVEGTQGSYTIIRDGDCPRCGYDRIRTTHNTLPGVRSHSCNACGASWENRRDEWSMPTTDKERVKRFKNGDATERVSDSDAGAVYTGGALDFAVVTDRSVDSWWTDDFLSVLGVLVKNDIITPQDVGEAIDRTHTLGLHGRLLFARQILPDGFEVTKEK